MTEKLNTLGFDLNRARDIGRKYYGKQEEQPIQEPTQEPQNENQGEQTPQVENPREQDNYIFIPSINLWVSKERYYLGSNWHDCTSKLHKQNERMPTILEFREFLNYTKINAQDIYKEITEVRNPWRSEWLDANFKVEGKNLFMYYHEFDSMGKIIQKKVKLDNTTLMQDKTPGISLDSWLADATKQGLPKEGINDGSLDYWFPRSDNNSVARFFAGSDGASLGCNWYPSSFNGNLGVRAVRR